MDLLYEIDYGRLQAHLESGVEVLPDDLALYLDILNQIRAMYVKYQTKPIIARTLKHQYGITYHLTTKLYYDALNFFNLDAKEQKEAYRNFYADRLEDIIRLAIAKDDLETARRTIVSAAEMRGVNTADPPPLPSAARPIVIITTDSLEVDIPRVDRNTLARMIDSFDITESDKDRLKGDAGITKKRVLEDIPDAEIVD